jgi:uncharacterized protein (TIGR02118 family)
MIKVSIFYPEGPEAKFDMTYYLAQHMPMVRKLMGEAIKGMAVDQGLSGAMPGSAPTYRAAGHLLFESVESFHRAFVPHMPQVQADVPKYTNIQPVVQISEVKM